MRALTSIVVLLLSGIVQAQTYFYIDAIAVQPANPTELDPVIVRLSGGLAGTGVTINSADAVVDGFNVNISVNVSDNGGATVIVPHSETLELGTLEAGTYTIVVEGAFVDDLAPQEEHQFTVASGGACADLELDPIYWYAFADTAVVVTVRNPTSELFPYPSFILFNDLGEELAVSEAVLFGLPAETSTHILRLVDGITPPEGPFSARLVLMTGFGTEQACTWERLIDLCPPPPCVPLQPFIRNESGAPAFGTFNWGILQNGEVVANGTFEMAVDQQFDADSICIPPGSYTMICGFDGGPAQGTLNFGLGAGPGLETPTRVVSNILPSSIDVRLYRRCIDPLLAIPGIGDAAVQVMACGDRFVVRSEREPMTRIALRDLQGRLLMVTRTGATEHAVDMAAFPQGVHIVEVTLASGGRHVQRVFSAGWDRPASR
jgi:hypothetical protein